MPKKTIADRPTVFISYSHRDKAWKERVVAHLKVLELEGNLEVWDDRRIEKGSAWLPEIQAAMDCAVVALLLISKDFLTSGFIRGTEVPRLLQRRIEEGLRVVPLFIQPCAWKGVKWLADIQGGPEDSQALAGFSDHDADQILADLALEIQGWLNDGVEEQVPEAPNGGAGVEPGVSTPGGQTPKSTPSPEGAQARARGGNPAGVGGGMPASLRDSGDRDGGRGGDRGGRVPGVETPGYMPASLRDSPPRLDLGRLPIAGPYLIGRETALPVKPGTLPGSAKNHRFRNLTGVRIGMS